MFYNSIEEPEKLHQAGRELQFTKEQDITKPHQLGAELADSKLQQAVGEFPLVFALILWRHHVEIITKSKSIDESIFCLAIIYKYLSINSEGEIISICDISASL